MFSHGIILYMMRLFSIDFLQGIGMKIRIYNFGCRMLLQNDLRKYGFISELSER
jgi:hypothetical protein